MLSGFTRVLAGPEEVECAIPRILASSHSSALVGNIQ